MIENYSKNVSKLITCQSNLFDVRALRKEQADPWTPFLCPPPQPWEVGEGSQNVRNDHPQVDIYLQGEFQPDRPNSQDAFSKLANPHYADIQYCPVYNGSVQS